ncbi:MAG: hypothetical protein L0Z48_07135 [candidate division Zixibacteria bacterium]|nr:hypothetical protein [candidate division Zixibacteria bacterium]
MKGLVAGLILLGASTAFAQPDPRDSIILESKTLPPNLNGDPAFTIRVSITNKDSLTYMTLALRESTIVGTAYVLFVRGPGATGRTFGTVVTPLTNTLRYFAASSFGSFNNDKSPDKFLIAAGFDPARPETIEPSNSVRKGIWELKFKHTSDSTGQVIFDTTTIVGLRNTFTTTEPRDHPANFVPSIITLEYLKGDLDKNTRLAPADVVLILNAVMLNIPPPRGFEACDLNCDGERTIADVMLLINAVFLAEGFPC